MLSAALLMLAVLSAWGPRVAGRPVWPAVFALALVAAVAEGVLASWALAAVLALAAAGVLYTQLAHRGLARALGVVVALLALALALHVVPGAANPVLAGLQRLSPQSLPFRPWLSVDKGFAGLVLLLCFVPLARSAADWRQVGATLLRVGVPLVVLIVAASLAAGYVAPDPKWPAFALPFLAGNLLFTCVAEEAFFRGLIQRGLATTIGAAPALAIASLLFGLAHLGGGPLYAAIAAFAGLGYGWAYQRSARIEAAILCHFALNAVHFLGFSYPALSPH
ncbi:CPBP family intramembrane glutamic endopeptidase [Niveibacterium microcysteis]|uniref:CPBP family intramembrane metalloprotease n=1 Tax=Niveibacterium microcysteis TaxID=2811415 RepID=A0ABX7M5F2_9RHOO|nr:CPBP family intramembrane glutamic endopeptidase [Niveibacterium microcysteis]QSI76171.1 CPBP family intramembrane metalloprotease [Niveibacterium microcysteis]